jgi:hypothetical protein
VYNIAEAESVSCGETSLTFPSAGIWFYQYSNGLVHTKSLEKYEVKYLDEKYIPDIFVRSESVGAQNGIATLDENGKVTPSQLTETSWNDIDDRPFGDFGWKMELVKYDIMITYTFDDPWYRTECCHIGASKTKEELIGAIGTMKMTSDNSLVTFTITSDSIKDAQGNVGGATTQHNSIFGIQYNDKPMFMVAGGGVYAVIGSDYEVISLVSPDYETKQIDKKFLADYYTKSEIDNLIGDFDTVINSINTLIGGDSQ